MIKKKGLPGLRTTLYYSVVLYLCGCIFFLPWASAETKKPAGDAKKPEKVTFNFVDVELPAITKFISDITKKNFIFDERVKGKITIIAPSKLNVDEAYDLFTSVLELKGFTVVPSGVDVYKIIPSSEAKQRGVELTTGKQPGPEARRPVNESYIARLIPLKNISSDDALKFLQPIVSKDGYASAFGPGNLLLVIDSGLNMEKILSIVDSIDQPSLREGPELVFLKHASADAVAKILNEGMGRKFRSGPQPVTTEEARAVADSRLNAVVLFGDRGVREAMKTLIQMIDVPSAEAQGRIMVYFLENADATDLAKVLDGIIKGVKPQQQAAPGAAPMTPFEAPGGITITPDKASNSLVIVASPADQANLLQVVKQLDKRRRQVYVEAMIVEASMDKLRDLGVKWRGTVKDKSGQPITIGGFGTIDQTALLGVLQGLQGATAGGLGNFINTTITTVGSDGTVTQTPITVPGFAALLSLNDFKDVVNVLSTPQILTSDNKEAEILVGANVPFISQTQTGVATSTSILNSIVRQDIGIILRITPQITEGDHIKLDLYQEISDITKQSDTLTISVGPTITKRSTKTSVVVKDGQTVVIGGLMQEREEEKLTKMPFVGDIPVLGWLFRQKSVEKTKTNLLVFLTPNVIKEPARLAQITENKQKEFGVSEKRYAAGELMVKFKEGVTDPVAREIISKKGASVIKYLESVKVYHIKLQKGEDVEDAVKEFSGVAEVEYAEPNYIVKMQK